MNCTSQRMVQAKLNTTVANHSRCKINTVPSVDKKQRTHRKTKTRLYSRNKQRLNRNQLKKNKEKTEAKQEELLHSTNNELNFISVSD